MKRNKGLTLGNGLQETRSYDTQGRTTSIALGNIETRTYDYDLNGNILELDKPTEGRQYGYDVLDRLTSDEKLTTGALKDYTYQYDENGNRTKRISRKYLYEANSNMLIKDGQVVITHDAAGNSLNYLGGRTFTYNNAGRMRTISKSGVLRGTYRYNAFGQRTRKEIPNKNSQVFHYDLAGNLIMRSIQSGKPLEDYIWVNGALRQFTTLKGRNNGTINFEKVKTFITPDHLLTPRLGTNDAQTLVWRWDSDAFNIKRPPNDLDGDGIKINLYVGFPGQFYDNESTLYYNWNRYYDRQSGRYVTSDPIGLDGGLNTYLYANANPLMYLDPYGLAPDWVKPAAVVIGATGGLVVRSGLGSANPYVVGVGTLMVAAGFGLGAWDAFTTPIEQIDDVLDSEGMDQLYDGFDDLQDALDKLDDDLKGGDEMTDPQNCK